MRPRAGDVEVLVRNTPWQLLWHPHRLKSFKDTQETSSENWNGKKNGTTIKASLDTECLGSGKMRPSTRRRNEQASRSSSPACLPPWLMKALWGSVLRGARFFLHSKNCAVGDVRRSNLRIVAGNIPESDLNYTPHLKLQEDCLFHSENMQVSSSINFWGWRLSVPFWLMLSPNRSVSLS